MFHSVGRPPLPFLTISPPSHAESQFGRPGFSSHECSVETADPMNAGMNMRAHSPIRFNRRHSRLHIH